jgi:hypothetical protein
MSVYDGRDRIGAVQRVDDQWRAIDTTGTVVGTFSNQLAAMAALVGERP